VQPRDRARSNPLAITRPPPRGLGPHPLPLHSWDPPEAPRRSATTDALNRLRSRVARLGHRSARIVPEHHPDTPPAGPAVTIRFQSTLPPRHPPSTVQVRADEPVRANSSPSQQSVDEEDEGNVLHTMTVHHRDPLEARIDELKAQRCWLHQTLKDWSGPPDKSAQEQSILGILMNMKMAANPSLANAVVRRAGVEHLKAVLSEVDDELKVLAAERSIANTD